VPRYYLHIDDLGTDPPEAQSCQTWRQHAAKSWRQPEKFWQEHSLPRERMFRLDSSSRMPLAKCLMPFSCERFCQDF
jgi:hypothetical protein